MTTPTRAQLQQMANKLRAHAIRMTTTAGSGHPSTCCSCADLLAVLFFAHLRFDPTAPAANDVDHFILSKGHAAPILWAALAETGAIQDDLLTLRQLSSVLEGHPSPRCPWIRVATGSLGQGLSAGCGMAHGKHLAKEPGEVYVLLGDGECAEGAVWEAIQFAGHYRLGNLCAIVDLNRLGQSGTSYFQHDAEGLARRFAAFGWQPIVIDGHDLGAIQQAYAAARQLTTMPTVIIAKTIKGKGVSLMADRDGWHGKAVPADALASALAELGPVDVQLTVTPTRLGGPTSPERCNGMLGAPHYEIGQQVATREAYGAALARLAKSYPRLVALDADTKNSTFSEKLLAAFPQRFVECFIAEQNMVGMALGLAATGWIPCVSTFAAFFTRAYDFIRMAMISQPPQLLLCGSHAGVSIGEDGPSQMALEDLAMMRGLVESTVVYPCDAVSTERLVAMLIERKGVSYLRSSRPKTPVLYPNDEQFPIGGSKTLLTSAQDRCTLVAAGVTVVEALKAAEFLQRQGVAVRVIDAYSIKPLDGVTIAEAAAETGNIIVIEDHAAYGGLGDAVASALAIGGLAGRCRFRHLAVRQIPRSGKPDELLALYGLDAATIVKTVSQLLQ